MSDWPESSTGRAMEDLREAWAKFNATIIREVRKDWPWLIVVYLGVCGLALLINWFVTGNIFS